MDEKEFFKYTGEQLKASSEMTNHLYPRASLLLTVITIVGGASYSLGRFELVRMATCCVTPFIFCAFSALTFACLAVAGYFVHHGIRPRDYPKPSAPSNWFQWRSTRRQQLESDPGIQREGIDSKLDDELRDQMLSRMMECVEKTNALNQDRLVAFDKAIRCVGIALGSLGGQVATSLILKLQGIWP